MGREAELNPYAVPLAPDLHPPAPAPSGSYRREGDLLVFRDEAVLPPRCVLTNQPIGHSDWTKRLLLIWTPPWVRVLVVVNFLIALFVWVCINQKAFLTLSMSRAVRHRLVMRRRIFFAGSVAGGVVMLVSILCSDWNLWLWLWGAIGGGTLFLGGLIALATTNALTVTSYHDGWFALKGCSKEFLDSLEPHLSAAPPAKP